MDLVILGATGRTGQLVVEHALAAGHNVTALVRSPERLAIREPNLRVVAGQATDADDVARAMAGADALISTLGGSGSVIADSTRAIIEAARKTGVRRVIVLSSFLVQRDRMGPLSRLVTTAVRGSMINDKNEGDQLLKQSDLDWTICYPGPLTDAPATGVVKVLPEGAKRGISERIARGDVARWLVEAAASPQTIHRGIDITG